VSEPALEHPARELYVRHARLDGRSVAVLRAIDEGPRCIVQAEIWPADRKDEAIPTGPYVFPTAVEATRFVTHVVEAFIALGCEVAAS
jgi:hypothetical protein